MLDEHPWRLGTCGSRGVRPQPPDHDLSRVQDREEHSMNATTARMAGSIQGRRAPFGRRTKTRYAEIGVRIR